MQEFWYQALAELQAGRSVFLILVVASTRGSPGTPLSSLLITEDGKQLGTIGGGCMEEALLQIGRDALANGDFVNRISKLEHRDTGRENASGLICGGSQTNLLVMLTPSKRTLVETIVNSGNAGEQGLLSITETSWEFRAGHSSSRSVWLDETSGWRVNLSILNSKRIAIFGGGHCGAALARQMRRLGFSVSMIEPRTDLFTLDSVTTVNRIPAYSFEAGAALVEHPETNFAVVLTPSARHDVEALTGILNYPFPYIGVMGSRSKLNMIKKSLREKGFGEAQWQRITAPAGLAIDSDTPEEIAVSISAQILRESRKLELR